MKPVFRQISATAVVTLIGMILTMLLGVFLARLMGVEGYGQYSFFVSVCSLLSLPLFGGLPTLIVREVALLNTDDDIRTLNELARFSVFILFCGVVIVAIFAWVFFGRGAESLIFVFFAVFLIHVVTLNAEGLLAAFLRGSGNIVWASIPKNIIRPLVLVLILYSVSLAQSVFPIDEILIYNSVAWGCVCLALFILYRSLVSTDFDVCAPNRNWRRWFGVLIPLTFYGAIGVANVEVITVILGGLSSARDVGLYKVAMALAVLVSLGLGVVNFVLAPQLSSSFSLRDTNELNSLIRMGGAVTLVGAVFVTAVVFLFCEELIYSVFGSQFIGANLLVKILVAGELVNVLSGSPALLLNMGRKEKITAKIMGFTICLTTVLAFILIPLYGGVGASLVYVISLIFWNVALCVLVYKTLGLHSSPVLNWILR